MRFARSSVPGAALLVSVVLGIASSIASAQADVLGRVFGRARIAIKQAWPHFSAIPVSLLGALLIGFGSVIVFSADALAQNPVPLINQPLVPDATAPGGPQFTLTVNGTGFVSGSVVNWNTTALVTQFVGGSQLKATVPAADIAIAGTASVTVVNPTPGGGASNVAFFTVTASISASMAFTLASYPAVGSYPYPIAVGDFNRDGKLDLAVVNSCGADSSCKSPGTVSILLGDGTGNFTLASSPGTGDSPSGLVVGDFNGDGELDLAVPNYSDNTVSILLGDGTGNFTLASSPATGDGPASVAAGDFNGDGKLDLAVANKASNTVSILLGDGTGNFTLASSPATGGGPNSVAAGDFNGDGKLDLAVVNENDNTVSILLGDGTGDFTLTSSPITGVYPQSVAVGDLNGDGKLDLAIANGSSDTVSILLGDGTGNFTLASSPATGVFPASMAVGDFNGDGKLDFAVVNSCGTDLTCDLDNPGSVSIMLGDGTGNFTLASSPGTGDFPSGVAVGDFNGDGELDLAVANTSYPGTVSILLQGPPSVGPLSPASLVFGTESSDTTSAAQTVTFTNTNSAPINITSIVASGDFAETNNCGISLATGKSCTISVTFTPTQTGIRTGSLTVTDNAPGSPQVVSLSGAGALLPGMNLLPPSLNFQTCGGPTLSQSATLTNNSSSAVTISSIATSSPDFSETNNCGTSLQAGQSCTITVSYSPTIIGPPIYPEYADLAVTTGTGTAELALSGIIWECSSTMSANPSSFAFEPQLVGTTSNSQTITVTGFQPQPPGLSATVSGNFSASVSPPYPLTPYQWGSTVTISFTPTTAGINTGSVTINGTGSNGLVTYTPLVIPLSGTGAAAAEPQNPVPLISEPLLPDATAPGSSQFALTVNGTGFVSGSVVYWNTTALATQFVSGSQLTATVPAADIATASTASVTVVSPTPGGGTSNVAFFTVAANSGNSVSFNLAFSPTAGNGADSLAVGDFNGDGKLDLAVANECGSDPTCVPSGTISILLGDGTGNFTPISSPATGGNFAGSLAVGDFNGDGKLDLAVVIGGNMVSILLGDGTGNFNLAASPSVGYPASVAVGDFNGDGKLDLAVTNGGDNTVSILLGDGTGNFTAAWSPATGSGPDSVVVGDFNGDGKLDLAVVNSDDNTVSILLGDGTGNFTAAGSPATGSGPQSAAVGDFNGDGKLDLAVTNTGDNTVSILLGDGTGNFTLASSPATGDGSGSVAVGDFNGDGKLDLAVANHNYEGTVSVLLGDGTGNFTPTPTSPPITGVYPQSIALGDFNRDGKLDVAVANFYTNTVYTNTVSILLQLGPAVTLSPSGLSFATQSVSTTSGRQTVTLSNSGKASLVITDVTASGDFAETNTCSGSVALGASCTISVTFTPTAPGTRTGIITIYDNAPGGPQIVTLTGTGTGPAVALSASTVPAGGQVVGTTSAAHTVTLTNTGNAALNITGIAITPAAFAETNKCGASLAAGASCTITVTFTPSSAGEIAGMLSITDNASSSPQHVTLSGMGEDFTVGPYNLSATVNPGATTSYDFQVAPLGGFNQTVSLACSGAPQQATCTLTPASIVLDGRNFAVITLQLTTTAPSSGGASGGRWPALPPSGKWFVGLGATMLLGLLGLLWLLLGRASLLARSGWKAQAGQLRLRILVLLEVLLIAVIGWAACGGAGAPVFTSPTGGTPAGNFVLTVTATSGHLTHSTTAQLTVR